MTNDKQSETEPALSDTNDPVEYPKKGSSYPYDTAQHSGDVTDIQISNEVEKETSIAFSTQTDSSSGLFSSQDSILKTNLIFAEEEEPIDFRAPTQVYEKKEDKYQDMVSSAYTFFIVGIAGLVILLLIACNVIQLDFLFRNNILLTVTSYFLFIVFVVYGIYLFRKSKVVAKEAVSENQLTLDIMDWFRKNMNLEMLEIGVTEDMLEEEKYYKRMENIKTLLQKTYGELEEGYLDKVSDDLYQEFCQS